MKKLSLALAALVLIGGGCMTKPAPQTSVEQPVPQPAPEPQPEPAPVSEDSVFGPSYKANLIVIDKIRIGDKISSPLTITGKARGNWFFEASFPVELIDSEGKLLANGIAQAQSEWMTTNFVPFKTTLTFITPDMNDMNATLVFRKDNPSGLPQNDDHMSLPVRLDVNDVNTN